MRPPTFERSVVMSWSEGPMSRMRPRRRLRLKRTKRRDACEPVRPSFGVLLCVYVANSSCLIVSGLLADNGGRLAHRASPHRALGGASHATMEPPSSAPSSPDHSSPRVWTASKTT